QRPRAGRPLATWCSTPNTSCSRDQKLRPRAHFSARVRTLAPSTTRGPIDPAKEFVDQELPRCRSASCATRRSTSRSSRRPASVRARGRSVALLGGFLLLRLLALLLFAPGDELLGAACLL